jgi:hypothetical protein
MPSVVMTTRYMNSDRYGLTLFNEYTVVVGYHGKKIPELPRLTSCYSVYQFSMDPTETAPLVVSIIGTFAGTLLQLSPMGIVREIRQNKNVGCYRPDPLIATTGCGLVNATYSILSSQLISTISCCICVTLSTGYITTYIYYSDRRVHDIRNTTIYLLVALIVTALGPIIYAIVDSSDAGHDWQESNGGLVNMINIWVGVCATISIALMYSGQLTNMAYVVKMKDSRSISLAIASCGLFCSTSWTIYAGLILDPYFLISHGLGVVSSTTQLILKRVYPNIAETEIPKYAETAQNCA